MYITVGDKLYYQNLGSMTLESVWVELGQETLDAPECGDVGACDEANPWADMTDDDVCVPPVHRPGGHGQDVRAGEFIEEGARLRGSLRCQPGQIARLKEASSGVRDLDPAQNPAAAQRWQDQLQWCPVMSLWHTHSDVSSVFANGEHRGQSVDDLRKGLVEGKVDPGNLPPLVAVQHGGHLWVVFGNRRLKALKQFAERSESPGDIQARVIVHDFPMTIVCVCLQSSSSLQP